MVLLKANRSNVKSPVSGQPFCWVPSEFPGVWDACEVKTQAHHSQYQKDNCSELNQNMEYRSVLLQGFNKVLWEETLLCGRIFQKRRNENISSESCPPGQVEVLGCPNSCHTNLMCCGAGNWWNTWTSTLWCRPQPPAHSQPKFSCFAPGAAPISG